MTTLIIEDAGDLMLLRRVARDISLSRTFIEVFSTQKSYLPHISFFESRRRTFHTTFAIHRMAKPSGNRLNWQITEELIKSSTEELIQKSKHIYDSIGKVTSDEASFETVIKVSLYQGFNLTWNKSTCKSLSVYLFTI